MKPALLFSVLFCAIALPALGELSQQDLNKIRILILETNKPIGTRQLWEISDQVLRLADLDGQQVLDAKHVGLLPFTPLMKSPTGVEAEDWLRCPLILKFPWGSPQLSHFHLIERGLLGMRTLAKNRSRKTSIQQIMIDFSIISPTENLTKNNT